MSGKRRDQNWDDFRYFLAVARTGTLSAAASQLGTEHTTVSRRVRALEEALHNRLFHKSNSGYELTAAGERLLATAEAMESAFVSAKSTAGRDGESIVGTVRIGAPDGFGSVFLAPRMHKLAEKHRRLGIEILATARLFSLSKREADIAIGLSAPQQMRVVSRRLTDYRLYIYASPAYLDGAKPIRSRKDLKRHPLVGYIEDLLYTQELNYLDTFGADVEARIRSTNLLAQVHSTLAGSGLCILPAFIAAAYPSLVAVLPDEVALTRSFHMYLHEDHRKVPHVREAAAFIVAEVDRNQALFNAQPEPYHTAPRR